MLAVEDRRSLETGAVAVSTLGTTRKIEALASAPAVFARSSPAAASARKGIVLFRMLSPQRIVIGRSCPPRDMAGGYSGLSSSRAPRPSRPEHTTTNSLLTIHRLDTVPS